MSTALELFTYGTTDVRTVVIDGEPWFAAPDVCAILGYTHTPSALRGLRDREKGVRRMHTLRGEQDVTIINEPGLYRLVMRSNREEAEAFQDWVTTEVLPQIRRTGSYSIAPAAPAIPQTLSEALRLAADEHDARLLAERQVAELAPAAESWNILASADGDYLVADAAKILCRDPRIAVGQNRLFTIMANAGWIYRGTADRKWRTKQTAIETGRLSEIPMSHYHPRTGELVLDPPQIRVTVKGMQWLHQHLTGDKASTLALPAGVSA